MRHAFSLVELSIVLVILGLLTGGILTGQSLIRAAELRSVVTEFQKYQTAARTFQQKYFALPGDMRNATDFWGSMTNCGAASPSGTGTQTCNGDGNGQIEGGSVAGRTSEALSVWPHLVNAGLIEGTYTGIALTSSSLTQAGVNIPQSKLSQGGWGLSYFDFSSGDGNNFAYNYRNHFGFGAQGTGNSLARIMAPSELWGIDTKIDDGKPGMGKVIAVYYGTCTTAANQTDFAASYKLTDESIACGIRFKDIF